MRKTPPLTEKKRKWAANRDVTLRGKQLNYNVPIQRKYNRVLQNLCKVMFKNVENEVNKLFSGEVGKEFTEQQKEAAAMDASLGSQARILMNFLVKRWDKVFSLKSKRFSEEMLEATEKNSKSTLHTSLKELSGGLSLKTGVVPEGMQDVATAIVAENVSLIKSIPEQYLKNVTGAVMRSITVTGQNSASTLTQEIAKYSRQTARRVKNLALDQTRKAYNSINKQRMQAIGVKQFEWVHSGGGQHPRKSHQRMSGNIYSFDNLPIINEEQVAKGYEGPVRGIPGQAINCRCTMVPVIKFED